MRWRSRCNGHVDLARKHLDLARKMARHSLTEARRSVMDLRASALEGQDLPAALSEAARQWTAGSPVKVHVDVEGQAASCLKRWSSTCCESPRKPSLTP